MSCQKIFTTTSLFGVLSFKIGLTMGIFSRNLGNSRTSVTKTTIFAWFMGSEVRLLH